MIVNILLLVNTEPKGHYHYRKDPVCHGAMGNINLSCMKTNISREKGRCTVICRTKKGNHVPMTLMRCVIPLGGIFILQILLFLRLRTKKRRN